MIKKKPSRGIEIDLTGPDGNAFVILGYVKKLGRQLGYPDAKVQDILKQMRSGDYENLISVFDKEFGSVVTLYR